MELWIRSQDKEDLLETHNLGLAYKGKYGFMDKIGDIDGYCVCEFINDYHVKLGTYTTKERALGVLDEIQEAKLGNFHYRCPSNVEVSHKEDTIVYKMPKE